MSASDARTAASTTSVPAATPREDESAEAIKQRMLDHLPESVSNGLSFSIWGWLGLLKTSETNYYDAELSFAITKSFDQKAALSAQVNFIDADGYRRVELEQGYASFRLDEAGGTLLTIGRFNAGISAEGRDFWDRTTGTPSLLFAAQPQDMIGLMLTQRVGDSGLKIQPFLTNDFQTAYTFDQAPAGGLKAEYQPWSQLTLALTNMVGPGYVLYGGRRLIEPFKRSGYGIDPDAVVENWQGPNLSAERRGTLYFLEAHAVWRPRDDLGFTVEYLRGTTGSDSRRWGWQGWLAMADLDITDRLHSYLRWSYLDDDDWLITGIFQRRQEVSLGAGYHILDGLEVRAEYRHDFSDRTPGADCFSIHFTFTF